MRGVAGIRALRNRTLAQPDAPYAGLFPGFSDGGIMDIGAEYSSVYCTITGLNAAVRAAHALGYEADARTIEALSQEFLTSLITTAGATNAAMRTAISTSPSALASRALIRFPNSPNGQSSMPTSTAKGGSPLNMNYSPAP